MSGGQKPDGLEPLGYSWPDLEFKPDTAGRILMPVEFGLKERLLGYSIGALLLLVLLGLIHRFTGVVILSWLAQPLLALWIILLILSRMIGSGLVFDPATKTIRSEEWLGMLWRRTSSTRQLSDFTILSITAEPWKGRSSGRGYRIIGVTRTGGMVPFSDSCKFPAAVYMDEKGSHLAELLGLAYHPGTDTGQLSVTLTDGRPVLSHKPHPEL